MNEVMTWPVVKLALMTAPVGLRMGAEAAALTSLEEALFTLHAAREADYADAERQAVLMAVIANAPHFTQASRRPVRPEAFLPKGSQRGVRVLSTAETEAYYRRRRKGFNRRVLELLDRGGRDLADYATSRRGKEILLVREALKWAQGQRYGADDLHRLGEALEAMDALGLRFKAAA